MYPRQRIAIAADLLFVPVAEKRLGRDQARARFATEDPELGGVPAVNVFFELGRKGTSFAQDRLEAYRLSDIQHHTRLQSTEQVISCLNLINESFHRVRGSTGASFFGSDGDYCFVAMETQQNIRRLWFELVGHGEIATAPTEAAPADGPELQESAPLKDRPTASVSSGMQPLQG